MNLFGFASTLFKTGKKTLLPLSFKIVTICYRSLIDRYGVSHRACLSYHFKITSGINLFLGMR